LVNVFKVGASVHGCAGWGGLKVLPSRRSLHSHPERWHMLEKKNPTTRKEELRSFAFLTVVMAPVLAGLIIAGYGFLVWIFQMFAGPPHA